MGRRAWRRVNKDADTLSRIGGHANGGNIRGDVFGWKGQAWRTDANNGDQHEFTCRRQTEHGAKRAVERWLSHHTPKARRDRR